MHHSSDWAVQRGRVIILVLATCSLLASVALAPTDARAVGGLGQPAAARIQVRPTSGPVGTTVTIRGRGFPLVTCTLGYWVTLSFVDSTHQQLLSRLAPLSAQGTFTASWTVPSVAAPGTGLFTATVFHYWSGRCWPAASDSATFTVTAIHSGGPGRWEASRAPVAIRDSIRPMGGGETFTFPP